ncbi:PH domain-containing protein [Natrinema caseinilyticum]|uniref:PH domain-containing protein n=1 Tax=Natrinema caseinilyticum TaxID=2961570 RepID=UPI0020C23E71|nr:PH domain-containing protein [Natrinema caseinilyticum]
MIPEQSDRHTAKRLHIFSAVQLFSKGMLLGLGAPIFVTGLLTILFPMERVAVLLDLSFVLVFIGPIYGIARYLCFKYEDRSHSLVINSGVLARTTREIPYTRVQNIHVQRGAVSRLLGVATVMIETAGETTSEVVLGCISIGEAERLQQTIRDEATESDGASQSPTHLFSLNRSEFLILCLTSFLPGDGLTCHNKSPGYQ